MSDQRNEPDQAGSASFETERHRENQPPREDLIPSDELDDIEPHDADPAVSEDDAALPRPTSEDLPESQGEDLDVARRRTEDAASRPPLHDEER